MQAKDDPDDIFIPSMIATLDDKGVRLEVLSLDIPQEDEAHLQVKTYNSNLLARIMSESTVGGQGLGLSVHAHFRFTCPPGLSKGCD